MLWHSMLWHSSHCICRRLRQGALRILIASPPLVTLKMCACVQRPQLVNFQTVDYNPPPDGDRLIFDVEITERAETITWKTVHTDRLYGANTSVAGCLTCIKRSFVYLTSLWGPDWS